MNLAELPKQYAPQDAQRRWYQFWVDKGYFHADAASSRKPYCIVIPPPNVTGTLHLGHALNNTLQDILIRWRRMQGYEALWMPALTTPASPPRPSSRNGCCKRRRKAGTTWAGRRWSSGSGPGRTNTRSASCASFA